MLYYYYYYYVFTDYFLRPTQIHVLTAKFPSTSIFSRIPYTGCYPVRKAALPRAITIYYSGNVGVHA
jgi:hypothetical protein